MTEKTDRKHIEDELIEQGYAVDVVRFNVFTGYHIRVHTKVPPGMCPEDMPGEITMPSALVHYVKREFDKLMLSRLGTTL